MIHKLICRTADCGNEGISIEFYRPSELVICGVCNQQITDISPPIPEGGYVFEEEEEG